MDEIKDVWWEGSSLDDLKQFPEDVKLAMGISFIVFSLEKCLMIGSHIKNVSKDITAVYEIRVSLDKNIFRTAYVAKFKDVVVVLHCWQKKSQTTSKSDLEIIAARYRSAKETLT